MQNQGLSSNVPTMSQIVFSLIISFVLPVLCSYEDAILIIRHNIKLKPLVSHLNNYSIWWNSVVSRSINISHDRIHVSEENIPHFTRETFSTVTVFYINIVKYCVFHRLECGCGKNAQNSGVLYQPNNFLIQSILYSCLIL